MSLKKTVLDVMRRDDLKAAVDAVGLEGVDRRSVQSMRDALARSRRVQPEMLLTAMVEGQVKVVCERIGIDPTGRKHALIQRLVGSKPTPRAEDAPTQNNADDVSAAPQTSARPTDAPDREREHAMTALSDLLRQDRPFVRSSVPKEEPVEVRRAGDKIRRRWPDVDAVDTETDAEALAKDMERRRRNDDWQGFFWSDVARTAIALLDSGLWQDKRFKELLDFILRQIGPGADGPFVRSMFRKYLDTFDPASNATRCLADVLRRHWPVTNLPIGSLVHHLRIFDLDTDPPRTIAEYMDNQHDPFRALRTVGMEAPHGAGLMQAAHLHFVEKVAPRIRAGDLETVKRLLDWISSPNREHPLQGDGAGKAMDALLLPWATDDPGSDIKTLLETCLVRAYEDPRGKTAGAWSACSGGSRDVMLRWLAGDTIPAFFDIVTQADGSHMWADRNGFWRDLHEEGRVTQAWFALSKKGMDIARSLEDKRDGIALAGAQNASSKPLDRKKCLLMMCIDGRWIVEGSHNFPTWVFPKGDLTTFRPYEDSYTCEQFRNAQGHERPERIVHSSAWKNAVLKALQT